MPEVVVERDVRPVGAWRMPPAGRDGIVRRRGTGLARMLHVGDEPALVRAWPVAGAMRLRAEAADRGRGRASRVERMRVRAQPAPRPAPVPRRASATTRWSGPSSAASPGCVRCAAREPFEALAWAITEQLIEVERAMAIQRRLVWRWGRRRACGEFRDAPGARACSRRARPPSSARARPGRQARARDDQGEPRGRPRPRRPDPARAGLEAAARRSPTSARGRSTAWPSTARAATTCCPRATSPT